jgi:hypothetical protein
MPSNLIGWVSSFIVTTLAVPDSLIVCPNRQKFINNRVIKEIYLKVCTAKKRLQYNLIAKDIKESMRKVTGKQFFKYI